MSNANATPDESPAESTRATINDYGVPSPSELRRLRKKLDVTQEHLADGIDSTQTTISQYEVGNHDIQAATLRRAVDFLQEVANDAGD